LLHHSFIPETRGAAAERDRMAIRSPPFTTPIDHVEVRVSLGITEYDSTDDILDSLLGRADAALFKPRPMARVELNSPRYPL